MSKALTAPGVITLCAAMLFLIAIVAGLVVYGVFVTWGHQWLIGVSPV